MNQAIWLSFLVTFRRRIDGKDIPALSTRLEKHLIRVALHSCFHREFLVSGDFLTPIEEVMAARGSFNAWEKVDQRGIVFADQFTELRKRSFVFYVEHFEIAGHFPGHDSHAAILSEHPPNFDLTGYAGLKFLPGLAGWRLRCIGANGDYAQS